MLSIFEKDGLFSGVEVKNSDYAERHREIITELRKEISKETPEKETIETYLSEIIRNSEVVNIRVEECAGQNS